MTDEESKENSESEEDKGDEEMPQEPEDSNANRTRDGRATQIQLKEPGSLPGINLSGRRPTDLASRTACPTFRTIARLAADYQTAGRHNRSSRQTFSSSRMDFAGFSVGNLLR